MFLFGGTLFKDGAWVLLDGGLGERLWKSGAIN